MGDGVPLSESVIDQLAERGGVGEGTVIVPCPNCRDDVIVMWAGVGGDGIPPGERPFESIPKSERHAGSLGFKKGGGECPTCGLEATPVLSVNFGGMADA